MGHRCRRQMRSSPATWSLFARPRVVAWHAKTGRLGGESGDGATGEAESVMAVMLTPKWAVCETRLWQSASRTPMGIYYGTFHVSAVRRLNPGTACDI